MAERLVPSLRYRLRPHPHPKEPERPSIFENARRSTSGKISHRFLLNMFVYFEECACNPLVQPESVSSLEESRPRPSLSKVTKRHNLNTCISKGILVFFCIIRRLFYDFFLSLAWSVKQGKRYQGTNVRKRVHGF